jgi:hypothetical protein
MTILLMSLILFRLMQTSVITNLIKFGSLTCSSLLLYHRVGHVKKNPITGHMQVTFYIFNMMSDLYFFPLYFN